MSVVSQNNKTSSKLRFIDAHLIEGAMSCVFLYDVNHQSLVSCSESLAHRLGLKSSQEFISIVNADPSQIKYQTTNYDYGRLLSEKKLKGVVVKIQTMSGEWVEYILNVSFNDKNNIIVGVGFENVKAGHSLSSVSDQIETSLGQFMESVSVGTVQFEIKPFKFIDCNDDFAKMFGLASSKDFLEYANSISQEELKQRFPLQLQTVEKLLRTKESQSALLPIKLTATGEFKYFKFIFSHCESEDYISGTCLDITDLVTSKRTVDTADSVLNELSSELNGVIFQYVEKHDGTKEFSYISSSVKKLLGIDPEDFIADVNVFWSRIHEDDLADIQLVDELYKSTLQIRPVNYRILNAKGEYTWVRGTSTPYVNDGGELVLNGMFVDITHEKQLEEEIHRLEGDLVHAKKLEGLGGLAGGVAHDFNNVLQSMQLNLDLIKLKLENTPAAEEVKKSLESMTRQCANGANLVHQILAFCRKDEEAKSILNVDQLLNDIIGEVKNIAPESISISVNIEDTSLKVLGDRTQLHQTLFNIMNNSIYAMKEKGGTLTVNVTVTRSAKNTDVARGPLATRDCIEIVIKDTGDGISESNLSRVMEPFFTTKPQGEGTGMGLSMANGVIIKHKGSLEIDSKYLRGTTVVITLPLYSCVSNVLESDKHKKSISGTGNIVLVDYDEEYLQAITHLLEALGYKVTAIAEPIKALAFIRANLGKVDLVMVNESLPQMNGLDFCKVVGDFGGSIPFILTSSFLSKKITDASQELKIPTLAKPFNIYELAKVLKKQIKPPQGD